MQPNPGQTQEESKTTQENTLYAELLAVRESIAAKQKEERNILIRLGECLAERIAEE